MTNNERQDTGEVCHISNLLQAEEGKAGPHSLLSLCDRWRLESGMPVALPHTHCTAQLAAKFGIVCHVDCCRRVDGNVAGRARELRGKIDHVCGPQARLFIKA